MQVKTRHGVPRIRRVPFIAPAPFGVELMTFAQLRAMAAPGYLTAPQRPAFHLLLITTAGAVTHMVDFQSHRLAVGQTLWVRPGQVQVFGDPRGDRSAGDLILFEPDFLIPHTQAAAIADDRFGPVVLEHPAAARSRIDRARRALRQEYARAAAAAELTGSDTETLRHLLSVLILSLSVGAPDVSRRDADGPYARFRELLERDFAVAHDVGHYAHALGYSSRTLGRATQTHAGATPKQTIQARVALEARRLLAHSDLPIATVATQVGFQDASNFSTFFTHQTGDSPTGFRRRQRP